jgi:Holliday junction resolvasome RuvABC endonuclease subunit
VIRVLGLDPSMSATGVALPDGRTYTISTGAANRGDARLTEIRRAMMYYLRGQVVDLAVIERPISYQSGDVTIILGMVHGVIREVLAEYKVPRAIVNLKTVKLFATGRGGADKAEMILAANANRRGLDPIDDDNQADAWWLRQIGLFRHGVRTLDPAVAGFPGADGIRNQCVNGPWPKTEGVAWPKPDSKRPGNR